MNPPFRRSLALVVLLVVLAVLAPATALAQSPAQEPGQPPITFGIRTSGATTPDDRGRFAFGVTPGAVATDHVAVTNVGPEEITLRVYAADAFNTPEGGFDILAAGRPSRDAGAWITLERDTVTVPGGGGVAVVPFRVAIPPDATPGDHAAGIVASLLTEGVQAEGSRVAVDSRVGVRAYLRVAGDLRPALSVERIDAAYRAELDPLGGSATVAYTVRNTGNLRLEGTQTVQAVLPWGSRVDADALPRLPELLPGNTITVTAQVPTLVAAGWVTAEVRLTPASLPGDVNPDLPVTVADATFVAVPWTVLAVLALLGAALWLRRLRRRRAGAQRPEPREPVRAGT